MLMDRYESLFFNSNFREAEDSFVAYRGELILKEGEVADDQGRRKPPIEVLKQGILLTEGDTLKLLAGSLDALQHFPTLLEKFGNDITANTLVVLFVVNIDTPFIAKINGTAAVFIPLVQGMIWNELMDMVALEKGDFKGQGAAEKVVTMYRALLEQTFKFPEVSIEEAMTKTNQAKRVNHGAV